MIIDDEPIGIEVIKTLIQELVSGLSIVGTATNGNEALQSVSTLKPDLIFLDLDMPYMNGIEVLQRLSNQSMQIIMTTGFEQKKINLASDCVCGWLTKPIDPEEFLTVVDGARKKIGV